MKISISSWFICSMKCFCPYSSLGKNKEEKSDSDIESKPQRKHAGWKAMPYVLGNESFERLATVGSLANIMVYLLTQYHMDQVLAANVLNIWSGTTNFGPLVGAFISDAYIGKFKTLAIASVGSLLGMFFLTLTAAIPSLHPPPCAAVQKEQGQCIGPNNHQLRVLFMALGFLTIGAAGIRPCSIAFAVDQFDNTTQEGRKGIERFFNWYYVSFTIIIMFALTVVVYIQSNISWTLGLGIPASLMLCAIISFWIGTRVYIYVRPGGSVFSGIVQVLAAAYKKRNLDIASVRLVDQVLYDPPINDTQISKLPLTQQFRWLNNATIIVDGEVGTDGSRLSNWSLVSIQQVEEVKCIIRIIPVWASGIIFFVSMIQQGTFTISQALKMDRHIGSTFQVPAGTMSVISMIAIGLYVPLYDQILAPSLRKITKDHSGITLLQRVGIGNVFSILSMVAAGMIERKRRASAILHARPDGLAPISVFWLSPQLILMGLAEALCLISQIEFYNREFPENMRSLANSLLSFTNGGGSYLSSLIVVIVHRTSGRHREPNWLDNNINNGRLDYFYFVIAGLGVLNFVYFLVCSKLYYYKGSAPVEGGDAENDIELSKDNDIGIISM